MLARAAILGTATEAPALLPGRAKGASNFRIDEDVRLANAYVLITTNAAVGTDQDASTFWAKIKDNFVRRGGTDARTVMSLKNRFNKVLQYEVNKYLGILHGVLREYKSGWAMNDYVSKAKDVFIEKYRKPFKHEKVYDVLKRSLVKYEINTSTIDPRVARALFFIDNDRAVEAERRDALEVARCPSVINASASINGSEVDSAEKVARSDTSTDDNVHATVAIQRPRNGKKKAKLLVAKANKGGKVEPPLTPVVAANAALLVRVKQERNASLARLAIAAEAKNSLLNDQLNQTQKFQNQQVLLQVYYMANPQSEKSIAYFERIMNENEEVNNRANIIADSNAAVGIKKVNRERVLDVDRMTDDSSDDELSVILLGGKTNHHPFGTCEQDDDSDVVFVKSRYNPLRDKFGKPMADDIKPPVAVFIKREFVAADDNNCILFASLPETQRLITALDEADEGQYSVVGDLRDYVAVRDIEEEKMQDDTQMTSLM